MAAIQTEASSTKPLRINAPSRPGESSTVMGAGTHHPAWLLSFVFFEIMCQLSLLVEGTGGARAFIRTGAFAASLVALVWLRGRSPRHPSSGMALLSLGILAFSFLNPSTNTFAGLAHAVLYVAIFGPIFWVPRIAVSMRTLRSLLLTLWLFHSMSSVFGALQVYYPGEFQPQLASSLHEDYLESLQITLASGDSVLRPMGLTDTPGGAGVAGFYAVLLAMGFLLDRPRWWFRAVLIASMFVGMFAIYLCQVRSLLIFLAVCVLVILALLATRGRLREVISFGVILAGVAVGGFILAASVGGDSVTNRLATLVESDPRDVYYSNRGHFLEETITELLPRYPLGAGLGRWGMMPTYFGSGSDPDHAPIWAEIQWTGWLLDGGIPLILAYTSALAAALWFAFKLGTGRIASTVERLWLWGVILVGYDLGALALTFNYPLFIGTLGLDFWLINGAVFAASRSRGPDSGTTGTA